MQESETQTKISVVVASFNRAHYLPGALESLTRQETDDQFEYEVLIVDNASTDNTREVVTEFAADSTVPVRYLLETKPGDAPPRNKGIRNSQAEWIAFFDDDQFAEPRWLLNLLKTARERNTTVVGGPVHLDLDEDTCRQLSAACRSTLREMQPYSADQPYEVNVIPGTGNLFVARSLFDRIGLFAEDIREGGSDWKLVNDAREFGVTPWFSAAAGIRHRVEGNRMTPAYFRWDAQNGGVSQADTDFAKRGIPGLIAQSTLRFVRAGCYLPGHAISWVFRPNFGSRQSSMIWWRTAGYIRRSITLLAPRLCPQKQFHEYVDFRTGRAVGTTEGQQA